MDLESTVHLCSRTIVELDCKRSKERGMRTEVMIEPMECASQVSHTTSEGRNVHAPSQQNKVLHHAQKKTQYLYSYPSSSSPTRTLTFDCELCLIKSVTLLM